MTIFFLLIAKTHLLFYYINFIIFTSKQLKENYTYFVSF